MNDVRADIMRTAPDARCVIGGPACGKTAQLVARARKLALQGAGEGEGVLYVCASDAAAERVSRLLSDSGVEVTTGIGLACKVLADPAFARRGARCRLVGPAEKRALMEDVKVCGIKRRRLRELVAFLECGWSNLDDSDSDWIKTTEEERVSTLIRENLEFTGGVLPCEASAAAYRAIASDPDLRARHARAHVLVDDFEFLGRATQALACALAGKSMDIAAGDAPPSVLDEPYPYAAGVGEFLRANPSAQPERLNVCGKPADIVAALNALRSDESIGTEPLRAAEGELSGGVLEAAYAPGIVEEFAEIAAHVRRAQDAGVALSDIFIAAANAAWRGNLIRYLEQAGIPAAPLRGHAGAASGPSLREVVGEGDPLRRSVQIARLRSIAQPQGLRLDEALHLLASDGLSGAEADDPLLSGLVDAYRVALGKMAEREEAEGEVAASNVTDSRSGVGRHQDSVRVGALGDACARSFALVVLGGFVNGFIPSAEYCDPAALVGAARKRAHASDVQSVYRAVAAAREKVVITGFSECSLEAAEKLKLHIARIRLKRGVRTCAIEPSDLLAALGLQL